MKTKGKMGCWSAGVLGYLIGSICCRKGTGATDRNWRTCHHSTTPPLHHAIFALC